MTFASSVRGALRRPLLSPEGRYYGAQMAAVVVLSYFGSMVAGLPERFWAVMSALIVMRPNMISSLDAGWSRICATMAGVLCGLLGVYLQRLGTNAIATTISIVAALSFASPAAPSLRTAAIAALIILGAGDLPGHAALEVALLRVVQIVIGIGVAMMVATVFSRYRAATRLVAGCASLLRRAADRLRPMSARPAAAVETEAVASAVRGAIGRLAVLAGVADRESRILRWRKQAVDKHNYRQLVNLTGRTFQDASALNRVLRIVWPRQEDGVCREITRVTSAAVANVADAVEGGGPAELGALRRMIEDRVWDISEPTSAHASTVLVAGPLRLLADDLQQLLHISQESPGMSVAAPRWTCCPHRN